MESTTPLINRLVAATLTVGWESGGAAAVLIGEPTAAYAAVVGAMLARAVGASNYYYAQAPNTPEAIGVLADIAAYRRLMPPETHAEHPAKMLCLSLGGRALAALAAEANRPPRALSAAG